jgi:hypothetical protein
MCFMSFFLSLCYPVQANSNASFEYDVPLTPRANPSFIGDSITQARHHSSIFGFLNGPDTDMKLRVAIVIILGDTVSGTG